MKELLAIGLVIVCVTPYCMAQQIDLKKASRHGLLETYQENQIVLNEDTDRPAITVKGIVWLKGYNFKDGTIEVDLRGRNAFQQSFLGIAFHGKDTTAFEVVYFRPFNFGSMDTLRAKHMVQYMSLPDHPWYKLRKEQPLLYENALQPIPGPEDWFHATIIISKGWVTVYVNHALAPSLKIKSLGYSSEGKIGLWTDGLAGDFSCLAIH